MESQTLMKSKARDGDTRQGMLEKETALPTPGLYKNKSVLGHKVYGHFFRFLMEKSKLNFKLFKQKIRENLIRSQGK